MDRSRLPSNSSLWWRDMTSFNSHALCPQGWLSANICRKVRNGENTLFWSDKWLGNFRLSESFSHLYQIAKHKGMLISAKINNNGSEETWIWSWRRRIFVWEEVLLEELISILQGISLEMSVEDSWIWTGDDSFSFSVVYVYKLIFNHNLVVQDTFILKRFSKVYGMWLYPQRCWFFHGGWC